MRFGGFTQQYNVKLIQQHSSQVYKSLIAYDQQIISCKSKGAELFHHTNFICI